MRAEVSYENKEARFHSSVTATGNGEASICTSDNAAFDESRKVTVKATVTEWFWANPHCFLKFDAKDDKGNVVHWVAETSNPPDMINRGWSKTSLKPGDEVTVTMIPVKNGQPIGRVQQVVLADGKILGTQAPQPAATTENVSKP